MKRKTINAVITKKFNEWIETIDNPGVKDRVKRNTIITGGCIASMLLQEKVNDFDIYFKDMRTVEIVTDYYIKKFKENPPLSFKNWEKHKIAIVRDTDPKTKRVKIHIKSAGVAGENGANDYQYFETLPPDSLEQEEFLDSMMLVEDGDNKLTETAIEKDKKESYRPVFLSTNAITLSDKIQLIIRFYGTPEDIHSSYDFVHCTNYWTSWDKKVVLDKDAMESLLTKELRYVGSKYPLCSIIRTRKFLKRGWSINAGQYVKMCMQLNDLDLLDINVLEDQLTGVDVAYFLQVINMIKTKKDIDSAYVISVIDKMF